MLRPQLPRLRRRGPGHRRCRHGVPLGEHLHQGARHRCRPGQRPAQNLSVRPSGHFLRPGSHDRGEDEHPAGMGWCWLSAVGLLFAQTRIASEGHWLRLIFSMVAARHSRIVLARAAAALQAMEAAEELEAFERHWQEFLHRVERVWIKCTAQYKSSSRWQGWSGEMVRLRRNDPLLSHLKNARDADQHTLSAITARRDRRVDPHCRRSARARVDKAPHD